MARLALHGGTPLRRRPFPAWPMSDAREKRALSAHHPRRRVDEMRQRIDTFRRQVEARTAAQIGSRKQLLQSTLLRLLNFLEAPTQGKIIYQGSEFNPSGDMPLEKRRSVTTVFQRPMLLERTVYDNVAFGLRLRGLAAPGGHYPALDAFWPQQKSVFPGIVVTQRGYAGGRYADDALVHCGSERQAQTVLDAIRGRLTQCGLELHSTKTRIVYCKDADRPGAYEQVRFDFLGYTFQPRRAKNRWGKFFVSFLPAMSTKAAKAVRRTIREWRMASTRNNQRLEDLARVINPVVRGWMNYYGRFYRSKCVQALRHLNEALAARARRKYRRFHRRERASMHWLAGIARRDPTRLVLWQLGWKPDAGDQDDGPSPGTLSQIAGLGDSAFAAKVIWQSSPMPYRIPAVRKTLAGEAKTILRSLLVGLFAKAGLTNMTYCASRIRVRDTFGGLFRAAGGLYQSRQPAGCRD